MKSQNRWTLARALAVAFALLLALAIPASAQLPCAKGAVNTPPLVNDDYYAWPPPSGALDVLANDADVDLDPLVITTVSQVTGGTASVAADSRSITFVPAPGATSGSLVYTVSDGVNSLQPEGKVRFQTGGSAVDFSSSCSGSKCTFSVLPAYTAGARWYTWDFGDQTTALRWTGVNYYKEYPDIAPGVTQTYPVTLTIDYVDGSRGTLTKSLGLTGLAYTVGYKLYEGGTLVTDAGGMSVSATFLSSTFPRNSNTTRYRYVLTSDLPYTGDGDFGFSDPLAVGAPVSISRSLNFNSPGTAHLWFDVSRQTSTDGVTWRTPTDGQPASWQVGQRTIAIVDRPPVVVFTAVKNSDGSFTFDPSQHTWDDRGLNPTEYEASWDFGDGGYAAGVIVDHRVQAINHPYERAGTYTVYLRVLDRIPGHVVTASKTAMVDNRPPKAAFTFACAGLTCSFDGSSSTDEEELTRYDWGYGDGAGGVGETSSRTFPAPGCYQVDLIVTDAQGTQGLTRRTVSVSNQQLARDGQLAIDVHARSGVTLSNLNGILEPDEVVFVEPAHVSTAPGGTALTGQLLTWNGNGQAGIYATMDATANYGTPAPGAKTDCWSTGDCYAISVNAPSRPAVHWDATLAENNSFLGFHNYSVHIGKSFADVPVTNPFYQDVEALLHWGVTGGCAPNQFCTGPITRRDFGVLLMRARGAKSGYTPPTCNTAPFLDVPCSDYAAPYIQDLKALGITTGCGGGNYCPDAQLTRAEVAVFLIRALGITPPACDETFADVQCVATTTTPKHWAADFISELYRRGITAGCSATPRAFCPSDIVNRDAAAGFLVRTFALDLAFNQCPRGTTVVSETP